MLNINTADAVPIWKQIEDEIRRLVAAGRLEAGGVVPSVRDMARELRVNPATVAKAYQHLTDSGILTVKRGEGTFVAEVPALLRKAERRDALEPAALKFASLAVTVGATQEEAISAIEAAFRRLNGSSK